MNNKQIGTELLTKKHAVIFDVIKNTKRKFGILGAFKIGDCVVISFAKTRMGDTFDTRTGLGIACIRANRIAKEHKAYHLPFCMTEKVDEMYTRAQKYFKTDAVIMPSGYTRKGTLPNFVMG